MFIWILSKNKKYYYAKENPTVRADLNKNIFGGGWFTDIFEEAGDWIEGTFLPESVKETISDIPVVGDIVSRGWLGPIVQQFTDEGKEAFTKGTGTAGTVKNVTDVLATIAASMAVPGLLGAGGGVFGSGLTLPGFGGGAGTQFMSSLGIPGFGAGGMFNPSINSLTGTISGTGATGEETMNFSDLLSRVTGQNSTTGGFDWATLTGQGAAQGSMPLDLFTGFTEGGFGNMSNVIDLITSLETEGGGGGGIGNLLKTVLKQITGGDGQPTGGSSGGGGGTTGIDWLDKILGLGATAYGGYETGQEAERQRDWLTEMYAPQRAYQQEQLGLFQDVFSPLTKQLGGELGDMFSTDTSALSNAYWSKGRNRIEDYFKETEQKASEVFAGSGMLGQGPANKYFTEELPAMKAKSMEDLVIDQVLTDYGFKQQNVTNMLSFLGKTPPASTFNASNQPYTSTNINWGNLLKDIVSPAQSPIMV